MCTHPFIAIAHTHSICRRKKKTLKQSECRMNGKAVKKNIGGSHGNCELYL